MFIIELCTERCLECTMFALFLSSSLIHSMIYLFPSKIFVPHAHEPVLHIGLESVHEVYALVEECPEEFLDISPVGKHLPGRFRSLMPSFPTDGRRGFLESSLLRFLSNSSIIQKISVNLYKEYTFLKSRKLEELSFFCVISWQPF